MGFGGVILGDFVNTVPPILYGLSITGVGTCFPLPRTGTPLSDVDLVAATHVSLLTSFELFLLYLLSNSFALLVPIATTQSWYTVAISA